MKVKTKYDSLITRLREADGPSRELDADIYEALGYPVKRTSNIYLDREGRKCWPVSYRYKEDGCWYSMAKLTSSLDAAVALADRFGIKYLRLEIWSEITLACAIESIDADNVSAKTPALALVIAVLTAWGERQG